MMVNGLILLKTLFVVCLSYSTDPSKPNVLFILGDDWGWNDFSWSGSTNIETPNLDSYKEDGLYLFHYYSLHICTPARSSLLSGKYASRIGMQHGVWNPSYGWAIPRDLELLPQRLQKLGYSTHMTGKWHLGFPSWADVPMQRGFDSYLGYLNGEESYFIKNYTYDLSSKKYSGYDFRLDNSEYYDDEYSTWVFANRTINLLNDQSKSCDPFFIYAAFQAIHIPVEPPQIYYERFKDCGQSVERCKITAEAYVFDEAFGKIMTHLKQTGMWENTLVVFANDNGGSPEAGANNWPLRGGKGTYWEGGFRVQAFVTGGVLPDNRRGETLIDLFHITDWYPTILGLIGDYKFISDYDFDGIDQSDTLLYGTDGLRDEMLLCIDRYECDYEYCAAVRYKNFKLVQGGYVISTDEEDGGWKSLWNQTLLKRPTVVCNGSTPEWVVDYTKCPWNGEACLYDIVTDPCEYYDVSDRYPEIKEYLLERFAYYNATTVDPLGERYTDNEINASDPDNFGGYWTPWQDTLDDIISTIPAKKIIYQNENEENENEDKTEQKTKDSSPTPWYKKWNFASCIM